MTIETKPRIYFIDSVDSTNNLLNFREPNQPPALELTATLLIGSRSMTDLITEVQRALNDSGQNTYTVTLDRTTRLITIAADDTFELLISSGSNVGLSPFSLLGFTGGLDLTGASTYEGSTAIGTSYVPQFLPQRFKDFDNSLEGVEASINEAASGVTETVTFGDRRFMEFNLKYITDQPKIKNNIIQNNPNAVQEFRDLIEFLIKKREAEFMKDKDVVGSFDKILLESTKKSNKGVGYELKEMLPNLKAHFESGTLRFRKV